jgi:lysophospholipase L1-like esterase
VRHELQAAYGDAGHGFVLPVPPWRSYRHQDIDLESGGEWTTLKIAQPPQVLDHYGLAGVAVETAEAGAFGLVTTGSEGKVSSFDLYYLEQPGGGTFDVLIDDQRVERIRTVGDARRPAYATFHVEDGPHSLKVQVVGDGLVRLFGVALERDVPGVLVDTLGINGSRVRNQLFWEDRTYREHLLRRRPDLVVLAYGTNESGDIQPIAEYESELRQVLTRIRETVPEASCLLIGPSDRPVRVDRRNYEDRPRTAEIIETQWRVALEQGCAFFDMVAFQGGPLSMVAWNDMSPPYAAPDHVHFTRRGYVRFGEVLLGALLEGFEAPNAAPDLAPAPEAAEVHATR